MVLLSSLVRGTTSGLLASRLVRDDVLHLFGVRFGCHDFFALSLNRCCILNASIGLLGTFPRENGLLVRLFVCLFCPASRLLLPSVLDFPATLRSHIC